MPKGAIATVRDLDLCVELDEPTLLVERVLKTAEAMQFSARRRMADRRQLRQAGVG